MWFDLEEQTNAVMGELHLVLKAATTPKVPVGAHRAAEPHRLALLDSIRQLLRMDLSAIEVSAADEVPAVEQAAQQAALSFLKGVLTYYRELAAMLDRLLQADAPWQRRRIRKLVGRRDEVASVLKALKDKIEDLEIATSPEVRATVRTHEGERAQAYLQRRHEALRTIEEFTRRQQEFLPRYAGRYVAFYQGRVVDSDVDRAALAQRFYVRYGNVPVCLAKPGETPETIRLVTPHLKQS